MARQIACAVVLVVLALCPGTAVGHGGSHETSISKPSHESPDRAADPTLAGIHTEIDNLRRQLADYEQRIRLRDVLGGLGYLAGIAGVAFYFLGSRRSTKTTTTPDVEAP
jgi:hypothetical protein